MQRQQAHRGCVPAALQRGKVPRRADARQQLKPEPMHAPVRSFVLRVWHAGSVAACNEFVDIPDSMLSCNCQAGVVQYKRHTEATQSGPPQSERTSPLQSTPRRRTQRLTVCLKV